MVIFNVKVVLEVWVSDLFESFDFDNLLGVGEDVDIKFVNVIYMGEGCY